MNNSNKKGSFIKYHFVSTYEVGNPHNDDSNLKKGACSQEGSNAIKTSYLNVAQ